jgi:hypothetical protein
VGFVENKLALGQVFLRVLQFSPVNIIPPRLSILISPGDNRPVGGHSSKLSFQPININNKNKVILQKQFCKTVNWIGVAQVRVQWWVFVTNKIIL